METERRSIRVAGWTTILLTPFLVFCGIEGGVRLLDLRPSVRLRATVPAWLDRNVLVKESRWIEILGESPGDLSNYYRTYRWDRYLFYRLQPRLDLRMTDVTAPAAIRPGTAWTFHTNSRGYNAREPDGIKRPGVYRILTLGDSSTFGWGVDTEDIYPHRLEALLRARHPGLELEVINLGVCGYSSQQGLTLLRREALALHPDLVVLSYGSNDYSRVPEPFDVAYQRNLGWSGAVRGLLAHSRAYGLYASWLRGRLGERARPAAGRAESEGVLNVGPDQSLQNLIRMVRETRAHGADPLLVTNCVPGDMAWPLHVAARETGAPLHDTEALLAKAAEEVLSSARFAREVARLRGLYGEAALRKFPWLSVYLTDECHPNRIGHQLLAEALAPMVEEAASFRRWKDGRAGSP